MTDDGLEVEEANGKFRWTYTSPGGAYFLGKSLHDTAAQAKKDGRAWLREKEKETKG